MTRIRAPRYRPTTSETIRLAAALLATTGLLLTPATVAHIAMHTRDHHAWAGGLGWLALTAAAAAVLLARPAPHALIPGDHPDQTMRTPATRGGW
ncbi:hypothetical protein ACQFYA_20885 [Promicromonospora sp. Marseille-Q5078]